MNKFLLLKLTYENIEHKIKVEFNSLEELEKFKTAYKKLHNLNGSPLFAIYKQIDNTFEYEDTTKDR